jgi:quinolinate synthase
MITLRSATFEPVIFKPKDKNTTPTLSVLQEKILALKKMHNAVILAHNYQIEPIQAIADFIGDSLGLSFQAAQTEADVIVFCGVHFMAETAKIVNPNKIVLLPDLEAGCSLSDACPARELAAYKAKNPQTTIVAYINCSAEVKALSDVICTSGNAVKIIEQLPKDADILFVPDQNLGRWVMQQTGRTMKLWPGSCYVHVLFTTRALQKLKEQFPDAPIVAHPECTEAVCNMADTVCSTEKMIHFCQSHPADHFIIATETGMIHRLQRELPHKTFIAGPSQNCACNECRFMKKNTLEKLHDCLLHLSPQIEMPEDIRQKAFIPIERMLAWSQ